jgi:hypothetical protein
VLQLLVAANVPSVLQLLDTANDPSVLQLLDTANVPSVLILSLNGNTTAEPVTLRTPEDGDSTFSETSVRNSATLYRVPEDINNLLLV